MDYKASPFGRGGKRRAATGDGEGRKLSVVTMHQNLSHLAKKKEDICNIYRRGALPQYTIFPA